MGGKAWGVTGGSELVLKTDVKCRVGVGGKCHSCLPSNILRSSVFVTNGVFYLFCFPIVISQKKYIRLLSSQKS